MKDEADNLSRRRFLGLGIAGMASAAFPRAGAAERLGTALAPEGRVSRRAYRVFSEGRIAGLRTTNRLIRSATAEGASPDGRMNDDGLQMYERLARGGVGLIITGHMVAARGGDVHGNQTHIDDARYVDAAASIAHAVHRVEPACKVIAQLSHGGPNAMLEPIAPSEVAARSDRATPRVLSSSEIEEVVAQFAASISRAREAGFDGVELHGAHGFLLNAFLSPATNRREDEYGGSAARRAAILARIVAAARRDVGPHYPILIKVSCNDLGEDEAAIAGFVEMVGEVEKAGVDAIDVSGRNPVRTGIDSPAREGYFLPFAQRSQLRVPVILTGGHRSLEHMEGILLRGNVEFLAMARPLLREPDLPRRFLNGSAAVAACISCNGCLSGLGRARTRCVQVEA